MIRISSYDMIDPVSIKGPLADLISDLSLGSSLIESNPHGFKIDGERPICIRGP